MTLQVDFWVLVSYLFGLVGFLGGLARWFIRETEKRQAERFASLERLMRDSADKWSRLEREVVESRLDAIYQKLETFNCVRRQEETHDRYRTGAP